MYNGNSRLHELAPNFITELVSTQTQLFYDPTTKQCRAIFNGFPFKSVQNADGTERWVAVGTDNDILHVDLSSMMLDFVCGPTDLDPVTGAPLNQISIYGILVYMKRAYDKFHNARAAEIAAIEAEAEAAAAAAEAEAAAAAAAANGEGGEETPPPEEPTP